MASLFRWGKNDDGKTDAITETGNRSEQNVWKLYNLLKDIKNMYKSSRTNLSDDTSVTSTLSTNGDASGPPINLEDLRRQYEEDMRLRENEHMGEEDEISYAAEQEAKRNYEETNAMGMEDFDAYRLRQFEAFEQEQAREKVILDAKEKLASAAVDLYKKRVKLNLEKTVDGFLLEFKTYLYDSLSGPSLVRLIQDQFQLSEEDVTDKKKRMEIEICVLFAVVKMLLRVIRKQPKVGLLKAIWKQMEEILTNFRKGKKVTNLYVSPLCSVLKNSPALTNFMEPLLKEHNEWKKNAIKQEQLNNGTVRKTENESKKRDAILENQKNIEFKTRIDEIVLAVYIVIKKFISKIVAWARENEDFLIEMQALPKENKVDTVLRKYLTSKRGGKRRRRRCGGDGGYRQSRHLQWRRRSRRSFGSTPRFTQRYRRRL